MDNSALRLGTVARSRQLVAVVDDDATTREVIQAILEFDGFDVCLLADAVGAHRGVLAAAPKLVILDMVLGGADGADVLNQLKSDPRTSSIPVIICTAAAVSPASMESFERSGCALLQKPFDLDVLLQTVRERVGR